MRFHWRVPGDDNLYMLSDRKKTMKLIQPRLRFDFEKLRNPGVACTFQATIGGKFPLIGQRANDMNMDTIFLHTR